MCRVVRAGSKAAYQLLWDALYELKNPSLNLTHEERRHKMRGFSGFGAYARQIFPNPQTGQYDDPSWEKAGNLLQELLTKQEYASAKRTTPTAFYTSPLIMKEMWRAMDRMGIKAGSVGLEPGCGIGNFFGASHIPVKMIGIEKDALSAQIAQYLYPDDEVRCEGIEESNIAEGSVDLAIGNAPFLDVKYKLHDRKHSLHDYCLLKSIDALRANGVVAMVTSRYTMDKVSKGGVETRKLIGKKADFLGAIRLPMDAFKEQGTNVVTDIVFFQKREHERVEGEELPDLQKLWLKSSKVEIEGGEIYMNDYFRDHPEQVLGEMSVGHGMHNSESLRVRSDGDLAAALHKAIDGLPENIVTERTEPLAVSGDSYRLDPSLPAGVEENSLYITSDQTIMRVEGGQGVPLVNGNSQKPMKADGAPGAQRLGQLIRIKEAARAVLDAQNDGLDLEARDKARKKLLRLYKKFTEKHGPINKVTCSENKDGSLTRRTPNLLRFRKDPDVYLVRALEEYDERTGEAEPADIMKQDLVKKEAVIESVDSAKDGLIASLNHSGRVDLAYIAKLYKPDHEEMYAKQIVIEELGQLIFFDPVLETYIPAEEYLSGNVRKKLALAKESEDPRTRGNVEALIEALPKDLKPEEIDVTLGTPWIPASDVKRFLVETLELDPVDATDLHVEYVPIDAKWRVSFTGPMPGSATSEFGLSSGKGRRVANAFKLTELALNQKMPRVYADTKPEDATKYPIDEAKTAVAKRKQALLKQKFADWAFEDLERSDRLCDHYNKTFNNIKDRDPDGSHLTFPGMTDLITMRPHQKNAVWRNLSGGNTGFFHVVGSGKTFTMAATGMEMKRMGLVNQPVYSVLNSTLDQFSKEFQTLYPNAKLLIATKDDFTKEGRKTLKARMLTGNYDAVIMAHSSFELMPMSPEYQEQFLAKEIEKYEEALLGIEDEVMHENMIKKIEKMKIKREAKLKELMEAGGKRDDDLYFDKLPADYLFYDEAHKLKNLGVTTKMERVAGISTKTSQRSLDALMKARYLQSKTPGRGLTFATGTPVSNSLVELYTMMYFLVPDLLEERGVLHFDAWAANFGEVVSELEIRPDANGHRINSRFADFTNLPELLSLFRTFADVQTQDMLKLKVPDFEVHNVVSTMTDTEKEILETISARYEKIRSGQVKPDEDNALAVVHAGRCLSLDVRMSQSGAEENPDSKINKLVDKVYEIWENTTEARSTQMVFSDLGVNPNDWGFCAYDEVIKKLVERGIPENEIARVGDKNEALFAKVKSGHVRVVLGSTEKMGTGINAQDHLVAIHHLDCPWKPADLSQRDGRGVRQGNTNKKVDIYRYMTEGSFDAYMWQTVESKAKFIAKCMSGSLNVRRTKDLGMSDAMSFANTKALASGNPAVMVMAKMLMELREQELLLDGHKSEMRQVQRQLRSLPGEIAMHDKRISSLREDIARRVPTQGDAFSMTVGDRTFKHQAKHKKGESARQRSGAALGLAIAQGFKTIATSARPANMKLGSLGGLDVVLTIDKHEWNKKEEVICLELRGSGVYKAHVIENPQEPKIDSLVGYLERELKDMDGSLARVSRMKETAEKDLAAYKERDGVPFESMKLLETLRPLHATLEAIITSQAKDQEDAAGATVDLIIEAFDKLMDGKEVDAEQILESYADEIQKDAEASATTPSEAAADMVGVGEASQPHAESGAGEANASVGSSSSSRAGRQRSRRVRGRAGGVGGIQSPSRRSGGHEEAPDAEPKKARAAGGGRARDDGSSVIADLGRTRRKAMRRDEYRRQADESLDDASAEDVARQKRREAKARVRELEAQAESGQEISLHDLATALDDSRGPASASSPDDGKAVRLSIRPIQRLIRELLTREGYENDVARVRHLARDIREVAERAVNSEGFWESVAPQEEVRSQLDTVLLSPPSDIYVDHRQEIVNGVMGMAAEAAGLTPVGDPVPSAVQVEEEKFTLTLTEVSKRSNISMPSLQKYKKLHKDRIPTQGSGRHMRYSEASVTVFQEIHAGLHGGRHAGGEGKPKRAVRTGGGGKRIGLREISDRTGIRVEALEAISVTNRDKFPVGDRRGDPRSWVYPVDAVSVFEELYSQFGTDVEEGVDQTRRDGAVDEAVGHLLARRDVAWSEHQIAWIGRFGRSAKRGELNRETLDRGAYRSDGGFKRLNQMFGNRLEELMADLNATVAITIEREELDALHDEVEDAMSRLFKDSGSFESLSLAYRVREEICANEGLIVRLEAESPSVAMDEFREAVADAVVDLGNEAGHEKQMILFSNDEQVSDGFGKLILEMVCRQTGIAIPDLRFKGPDVEQLGDQERETLLADLKEYFTTEDESAEEDLIRFAELARGWLLADETVMLQVANNSTEHARLGDFVSVLDDAVLEIGKRYQEPMTQYLNDRRVVRGLQGVMIRNLKEHLERSEGTATAPSIEKRILSVLAQEGIADDELAEAAEEIGEILERHQVHSDDIEDVKRALIYAGVEVGQTDDMSRRVLAALKGSETEAGTVTSADMDDYLKHVGGGQQPGEGDALVDAPEPTTKDIILDLLLQDETTISDPDSVAQVVAAAMTEFPHWTTAEQQNREVVRAFTGALVETAETGNLSRIVHAVLDALQDSKPVSGVPTERGSDGNAAEVIIKQARELGARGFAHGLKGPEEDSDFASLLNEAPEGSEDLLRVSWNDGRRNAHDQDITERKRLDDLDREEMSQRRRPGHQKQELPSVKAARTKLMAHLAREGWKMSQPHLQIQWAQHPSSKTGTKSRARLWFHGAHSVWTGSQKAQSSLHSDMREMTPESLVALAERRFRRERRLEKKVEQDVSAAEASATVAPDPVPDADPVPDVLELDARDEEGLRSLELETSSPDDNVLAVFNEVGRKEPVVEAGVPAEAEGVKEQDKIPASRTPEVKPRAKRTPPTIDELRKQAESKGGVKVSRAQQYQSAKDALWEHLKDQGWNMSKPTLVTPYADHPEHKKGEYRLKFKKEAIHLNQHSLWVDLLSDTPAEILASAQRSIDDEHKRYEQETADIGASLDRLWEAGAEADEVAETNAAQPAGEPSGEALAESEGVDPQKVETVAPEAPGADLGGAEGAKRRLGEAVASVLKEVTAAIEAATDLESDELVGARDWLDSLPKFMEENPDLEEERYLVLLDDVGEVRKAYSEYFVVDRDPDRPAPIEPAGAQGDADGATPGGEPSESEADLELTRELGDLAHPESVALLAAAIFQHRFQTAEPFEEPRFQNSFRSYRPWEGELAERTVEAAAHCLAVQVATGDPERAVQESDFVAALGLVDGGVELSQGAQLAKKIAAQFLVNAPDDRTLNQGDIQSTLTASVREVVGEERLRGALTTRTATKEGTAGAVVSAIKQAREFASHIESGKHSAAWKTLLDGVESESPTATATRGTPEPSAGEPHGETGAEEKQAALVEQLLRNKWETWSDINERAAAPGIDLASTLEDLVEAGLVQEKFMNVGGLKNNNLGHYRASPEPQVVYRVVVQKEGEDPVVWNRGRELYHNSRHPEELRESDLERTLDRATKWHGEWEPNEKTKVTAEKKMPGQDWVVLLERDVEPIERQSPAEGPRVWQTQAERRATVTAEPSPADTPAWGTDAQRQTFLDSFETPGDRPNRDAAWSRVTTSLSTARDMKPRGKTQPAAAWDPVVDPVQDSEDREHEGVLELERELAAQETKLPAPTRQVEVQEVVAGDDDDVRQKSGQAAPVPVYTLEELAEMTEIPLSTLVGYVEEYGSRIPQVGSGAAARYTAAAITVVTSLREFREQTASREAAVDVAAAQPDVSEARLPQEGSAPMLEVGDLAVVSDSDGKYTLAERVDGDEWNLQVLFLDRDVNRRIGLGWADGQWVEDNLASEADVRRFRSHLTDDEYNLLPDSQRTATTSAEIESEATAEEPAKKVSTPTRAVEWDASDEIENDLGEPQDLEGRHGIGMAVYRDEGHVMEDEFENDLGEPQDLEGRHGIPSSLAAPSPAGDPSEKALATSTGVEPSRAVPDASDEADRAASQPETVQYQYQQGQQMDLTFDYGGSPSDGAAFEVPVVSVATTASFSSDLPATATRSFSKGEEQAQEERVKGQQSMF